MMRLSRLTLALLIASLGAACDAPGGFCLVQSAPIEFSASTAAQIVRADRQAAVMIDAQNAYWRKNCR